MAKTSTSSTDAESASDTAVRVVKCRVTVPKLELPCGIAAKGKIVYLPADVYQVHADAGKVTFIDFQN